VVGVVVLVVVVVVVGKCSSLPNPNYKEAFAVTCSIIYTSLLAVWNHFVV
jgi:hypothetical protein